MLNPTRRTIIILPLVLIVLFVLSTLIIFKQEEIPVYTPTIAPQLTTEMKLYYLEKNLHEIVPLKPSVSPWENPPTSTSGIVSQKLLQKPSEITEAKCIPIGFGYTQEESDKLFDPNASFPNCPEETSEFIKVNHTHLIRNCNESSFYVLGKSPSEERFGRLEYSFEWEKMSEDIDTLDREFAFVKCAKKRNAMVFLKFNQKAMDRAKNITKTIADDLGLKTTPRPLSVFLLIFDSLSRFHMYRNFKKTIEFLNENVVSGKYKDQFVIYDFLVNHAHGENTIPNMIPYLFGYGFKYHSLRLNGVDYTKEENQEVFIKIQKDSIWKQFDKMGFVTMFGFDIIWDFLVPAVGREIKADHVLTNFWKASRGVFGSDNYINKHSCFGSHNSHYYMLKYVKEFLTAYKGVNRFGYTHITTAHEKSGTIIKTVDEDLYEMLKDLLEEFSSYENEDFVLVIAGDHGKHVSETDFVKPGWLENVLPSQLVLMNKELMARLGAHEMFAKSTQRLVSREDWHLTLKHLSVTPYGTLAKDSNLYTHWKKCTDTDFTLSLLLEPAGDQRTCKDLDIEEYMCTCLPFEEINTSTLSVHASENINLLIDFALEQLNSGLKSDLCNEIKLGNIKYLATREIEINYVIHRVRVTDFTYPNVEFELYIAVFPESLKEMYEKDTKFMPSQQVPSSLRGQSMKMQFLKVLRIDEYGGYMEEFAIAANKKPSLCVPMPPLKVTEISTELSVVFENLFRTITVNLGKEEENCFDTCHNKDLVCQPWALMMLANPDILMQIWRPQGNFTYLTLENTELLKSLNNSIHTSGKLLGTSNSTLVFPTHESKCEDSDIGVVPICPCK